MDKLEKEADKETERHGAVVANDQQDAVADADEKQGSDDSDVNGDDNALDNEEDAESLQIQPQVI